MAAATTPQAFNFETTGSPGAISQAFNNYINGWLGIQPAQGILQDAGTLIGHQMTAQAGTGYALQVTGETDPNNTWIRINLFDQPKMA